jgi:hypothetical protein
MPTVITIFESPNPDPESARYLQSLRGPAIWSRKCHFHRGSCCRYRAGPQGRCGVARHRLPSAKSSERILAIGPGGHLNVRSIYGKGTFESHRISMVQISYSQRPKTAANTIVESAPTMLPIKPTSTTLAEMYLLNQSSMTKSPSLANHALP